MGRLTPRSSVASQAVPPLPGAAGSPKSSAMLPLSRACVGIVKVCPVEPTVLPLLAARMPTTGSTGRETVPVKSLLAPVMVQLSAAPIKLWPCEVKLPLQSGALPDPFVFPAMMELRMMSAPPAIPPPTPFVAVLLVMVTLLSVSPFMDWIAPPSAAAMLPENVELMMVPTPPVNAPPLPFELFAWNVLPEIVIALFPMSTAPPPSPPPLESFTELFRNRLSVMEPAPICTAPPAALMLVAELPTNTLRVTEHPVEQRIAPPLRLVLLFIKVLSLTEMFPLASAPPSNPPELVLLAKKLLVTTSTPLSAAPPAPLLAVLLVNVLSATAADPPTVSMAPPATAVLPLKTQRLMQRPEGQAALETPVATIAPPLRLLWLPFCIVRSLSV